jgi:hypothetical protein
VLAHENVKTHRAQLEQQQRIIDSLNNRIALLEGGGSDSQGKSVDDVTIKHAASNLERQINRWAADTVSNILRDAPPPPPQGSAHPQAALIPLLRALFADLPTHSESPFLDRLSQVLEAGGGGLETFSLGVVTQSLLRHIVAEAIMEGLINKLVVTSSEDANTEISKIHDQLFLRKLAECDQRNWLFLTGNGLSRGTAGGPSVAAADVHGGRRRARS